MEGFEMEGLITISRVSRVSRVISVSSTHREMSGGYYANPTNHVEIAKITRLMKIVPQEIGVSNDQ